MSYLLFPGAASLLRGWSGFCRSSAALPPVGCGSAQYAKILQTQKSLVVLRLAWKRGVNIAAETSANDAKSDGFGNLGSFPNNLCKVPSSVWYGGPSCCDPFTPNHTSNGFRSLLTVFKNIFRMWFYIGQILQPLQARRNRASLKTATADALR